MDCHERRVGSNNTYILLFYFIITKVYEPSITYNSIFMPGLMASEQGSPFFLAGCCPNIFKVKLSCS